MINSKNKDLTPLTITKMKKIILIICIIFAPALCYSQPAITFNELSHNFGIVNQKEERVGGPIILAFLVM